MVLLLKVSSNPNLNFQVLPKVLKECCCLYFSSVIPPALPHSWPVFSSAWDFHPQASASPFCSLVTCHSWVYALTPGFGRHTGLWTLYGFLMVFISHLCTLPLLIRGVGNALENVMNPLESRKLGNQHHFLARKNEGRNGVCNFIGWLCKMTQRKWHMNKLLVKVSYNHKNFSLKIMLCHNKACFREKRCLNGDTKSTWRSLTPSHWAVVIKALHKLELHENASLATLNSSQQPPQLQLQLMRLTHFWASRQNYSVFKAHG